MPFRKKNNNSAVSSGIHPRNRDYFGGNGDSDVVVKEGDLHCLSRGCMLYHLVLTRSEVILRPTDSTSSEERFPLDDLFGVQALRHKKGIGSAYVCFYLYPRGGRRRGLFKNGSGFREKHPLVFLVKGQMAMDLAIEWKKVASELLRSKFPKWVNLKDQNVDQPHSELITKNGTSLKVSKDIETIIFQDISGTIEGEDQPALHISRRFWHIRKFLVILNPKSGQGKSVHLFHEKIGPILSEGGVHVDLMITERPGHARSMISSADLSTLDGIVTVGGDGLLYEVVNGLRSRTDAIKYSSIPVGIIAGGSGNGLARSIASYAGVDADYLKNPVLTTTLATIRGKIMPVNLCEIELDGRKIYSFLSVGWGLLSDIDIESEVLRSIGDIRFTLWSLLRLFNLRTYSATLTYVPHSTSKSNNSSIGDPTLDEQNNQNSISIQKDGDFTCVYSSCQNFIGADLVFAPDAEPNDGIMHLMFLKGDVGRYKSMQFLLSLDKGNHMKVSGVHYVRAKEFSIRSNGGINGILTIDGEQVKGDEIKVRICPQPLKVFTL